MHRNPSKTSDPRSTSIYLMLKSDPHTYINTGGEFALPGSVMTVVGQLTGDAKDVQGEG